MKSEYNKADERVLIGFLHYYIFRFSTADRNLLKENRLCLLA